MADKYERLIQFLKDTDVYEAYVRNLKEHRGLTLDEYYDRRCMDEKSVFLDAFVWAETKERYKYWKNINGKWLNKIEEDGEEE